VNQENRQEAALVPEGLRQALESNAQLREALQQSGMPQEFQAMVLGLATLRQVNPKRRGR